MFNRPIKKYQALTGNDPMFGSFTNYLYLLLKNP